MNRSFLYMVWGLCGLICTKEEYKNNGIVLHEEHKHREICCPRCGKCHIVRNGYRHRDFLGLPIVGKHVILQLWD